jgi:DNA polymerase
MYLVADFETRSECEITECGLHNYATHPTTRALFLGWRIVQNLADKVTPVEIWEPRLGEMPAKLWAAIHDPHVDIIAHNSSFERYIFKYVLNMDIPTVRFQDTQPSARYLSLPSSLDDVGEVLRLPMELRKDKKGKQLMELFSFPHTRKKKEGGGIFFNDQDSHPVEYEQYKEYCRRDCIAEQEVARRLMLLGVFPLPERERRIWLMDQKINDRGIPCDVEFVTKAFKLAERSKQEKLEEQNKATGLENANSQAQLLPWVQERGYPLTNLRKQNVELVLKDKEVNMEKEVRDVLTARMEAGSTSYKKLEAIVRNVSSDGRLRGQFIYCGASRTGRFSGNAVQIQNLARPGVLNGHVFEDVKVLDEARSLVFQEDYNAIKAKYGSVLLTIKNLIRTAFAARSGKKLLIADLASIETRVGAWLAQCEPLLRVFREGRDAYLDFATKMTGIPYEKLAEDIKSSDQRIKALAKRIRQTAKPGVLGAIYRLGGGGWGRDKNGDLIKTGLWGYAEAMGIEMTQEEAHKVVQIFRESYKEIPEMWAALEDAISDVLKGERTVRLLGPNNCIKVDKITIEDRNPILRITLPSGHVLSYMDAAMETVKMPWTRKNYETGEEEDVYRLGFTYYGQNQDTKNWEMIISHGGKTFEQITQALSRDLLCEDMLAIEEKGASVVIHAHDEPVCEVEDDPFSVTVEDIVSLMSKPVFWAPGLPLGADGFESTYYHK